MGSKKKVPDNTIALNKKARFEFYIEETFEAGLVLEGWEVKSLRAGKAQISDSHVIIKQGEAFLLGAQIQVQDTAATHIVADPPQNAKIIIA